MFFSGIIGGMFAVSNRFCRELVLFPVCGDPRILLQSRVAEVVNGDALMEHRQHALVRQ